MSLSYVLELFRFTLISGHGATVDVIELGRTPILPHRGQPVASTPDEVELAAPTCLAR